MIHVLPYKVRGRANAPTVLLLHGWPASGAMWDETITALSRTYRCITITAPHYGGRDQSANLKYPTFGYTFQATADLIATTIKHSTPHATKIDLIGFDMGSLWSQTLLERHPTLIRRVILVDVGVLSTGRSTWADIRQNVRFGVLYQYIQVFLFLLGVIPGPLRFLSDALLRLTLHFSLRQHDQMNPLPDTINSAIGYSYFHRHLQIVLEFFCFSKPLLTAPIDKFPKQPTLFIYGLETPLKFYSDMWLNSLNVRNDGSKTVAVKSNHWIMFEKKQQFIDSIEKWLKDTESHEGVRNSDY